MYNKLNMAGIAAVLGLVLTACNNASNPAPAATPVIAEKPVIDQHPQGSTYTQGAAAAALTVTATVSDTAAAGSLTYQWYRNTTDSNNGGAAISGAKGTLTSGAAGGNYTPPTADTGTTYYFVIVTNTITDNGDGGVKTSFTASNTAAITVNTLVNAAKPAITAPPQGNTYTQGAAAAALTVTATVSDAAAAGLTYQWYRNTTDSTEGGAAISGASGTLTSGAAGGSYTPPTADTGTTYYYVEVINTIADNGDGGSKTAAVKSGTAAITVNTLVNAAKPAITAPPQGNTYTQGAAAAALTVTATVSDAAAAGLTYQWYRNTVDSNIGGAAISGASGTLTSGAAGGSYTPPTADTGTVYYFVIVTNTIADNGDGGNKTSYTASNAAAITVNSLPPLVNAAAPAITASPQGNTYTQGAAAAALTVTATVSGAAGSVGSLTYQWYRNTVDSTEGGAAISGASGTLTSGAAGGSYTPPTADTGTTYYYVEVTNTIADNGDGGNKTAAVKSGTAAIIIQSADEWAGGTFSDTPAPVFGNVTVHDPSIFKVSDSEYRIVGSFLASAKTSDFTRWTLIQNGGSVNNYPSSMKYYPADNPDDGVQTMAQQRADVLRPTNNDGLNFFASDIHKMPNGKYYHYYSLTSSWKSSAIGVAIADSVDGTYITQGLFVRSAEAGNNKAPNGTTTWASNKHPNCIDPQAFFDKDGNKFYLVYGSWSGGIFLYELDPATGLPKADVAMNAENDGYGKRLTTNSVHLAIEAPYILYSPVSDYYYLFTSYGELTAAAASDTKMGNYNIRVFRSRNPDGPYTDANHTSLPSLNATTGGANYFWNYGVKIVGAYQFTTVTGESSASTGYLAPGHNSAYYDPATGRHFLIHHTRFVNQGESHQVRVRELFVNEDGWLVAAPLRYDGGTIRTFNSGHMLGKWKILSHERDNNSAAHTSTLYTFGRNTIGSGGSETGAGTWELVDGKIAHITIGGTLYKGVFYRGYEDDKRRWVNTFTALSADGIALWGVMTAD